MELADKGLSYDSIDVIIGAEYVEKCLLGRKIEINKISLRCSEFGLIAIGPVTVLVVVEKRASQLVSSIEFCHTMRSINQQLQAFWDIEKAEVIKSE